MKKSEIASAAAIAAGNEPLEQYGQQAAAALSGLAVEKTARYATLHQVAWFIRYQCVMLNGQLDSAELNELAPLLQRRVTLIGGAV